jgi:hypothetical protein
MAKNYWWAVGSLIVMVIGAFGPWAKVLFITVNGTDDGKDGWVVVGAAVLAGMLLLLYIRFRARWLPVLTLLIGFAGAATAAYDIHDISSAFAGTIAEDVATASWGIYVALIGSLSLAAASVALLVRPSRRPALAEAG